MEWRDLGGLPAHIRDLSGWEALSFHTPDWWRFLWQQSGQLTVTSARAQKSGWSDRLLWCQVCAEHSQDEVARAGSLACIEPLKQDAGTRLTFVQLVAQKPGRTADEDRGRLAVIAAWRIAVMEPTLWNRADHLRRA